MATIHDQTIALIALFASWYLWVVLRRTAQHRIDLYDLVMLSAVAIVPALFAFFPESTKELAEILGVAFPFVLLFGILFAALFFFVHRLTLRHYRAERDVRLLVQELSLLRHEVEAMRRERASNEPGREA